MLGRTFIQVSTQKRRLKCCSAAEIKPKVKSAVVQDQVRCWPWLMIQRSRDTLQR